MPLRTESQTALGRQLSVGATRQARSSVFFPSLQPSRRTFYEDRSSLVFSEWQMTIEAMIFDVDGTLVDSVPRSLECWRNTLKAFGHDISLSQLQALSGMDGD